jgi:hypothetical protein
MDEKIAKLLEDFRMMNSQNFSIIDRIRKMILNIVPEASEVVMYGGIVFKREKPFLGLFSRQNHVTLEIENGSKIPDPYSFLEGKGVRRHIVILNEMEIESKNIGEYITIVKKIFFDTGL